MERERITVAGIAVFFFIFALIAASDFNVSNQMAAAGASTVRPSSQVRVIKYDDKPRVWLESLKSNDKLEKSEKCQPKDVIDRYGGLSAYNSRLNSSALCFAGYTQATLLEGKIANADASLAAIERFLYILRKTYEKLAARKSIDGISLVGIPGGIKTKTTLEYASGIGIKCVIGNDGRKESEVPVGKASYAEDSVFLRNLSQAKSAAAFLKQSNSATSANIKITKDRNGKNGLFLEHLNAMSDKLSSDFIAADPEFLEPADLEGASIQLSIALLKRNGLLITDNDIPNKIWGYLKLFKGVDEDYVRATAGMTIGEQTIEFEGPIPAKYMLNTLKSGMAGKKGKIAQLEAEKKEFEAMKAGLVKQLSNLEKNNFGCN